MSNNNFTFILFLTKSWWRAAHRIQVDLRGQWIFADNLIHLFRREGQGHRVMFLEANRLCGNQIKGHVFSALYYVRTLVSSHFSMEMNASWKRWESACSFILRYLSRHRSEKSHLNTRWWVMALKKHQEVPNSQELNSSFKQTTIAGNSAMTAQAFNYWLFARIFASLKVII